MEYKEFKAKTLNDAITDALIEFEITSDMLEYEVIEEGSSGLLGLFSKDAVIRARKKEEGQEKIKEAKPAANKEIKADIESDEKAKMSVTSLKKEMSEIKDIDEPTLSEEKKEHKIISGEEAQNKAVNEILNLLFDKLGITAQINTTIDEDEKSVNIDIVGADAGELIGKRGATLDAIQYIASIIINNGKGEYYRVKLDTNNYRERRQKTLENLAKNVASKVKKTHKKVALEPMNPYERRVIHAYLQADKLVTTKSEGEEPNRRVVVYYKNK